MKIVSKIILLVILCIGIYLITALFLPIYPESGYNYLLVQNNQDLSEPYIIKVDEDMFIEIEIPEYYWIKAQPVKVNFYSRNTEHSLKINSISIAGFKDSSYIRINSKNEYLAWENGFTENDSEFEPHTIFPKNTEPHYLKYNTCFDLRYSKTFKLHVKSTYSIDHKPDTLDQTLIIKKYNATHWVTLPVRIH